MFVARHTEPASDWFSSPNYQQVKEWAQRKADLIGKNVIIYQQVETQIDVVFPKTKIEEKF